MTCIECGGPTTRGHPEVERCLACYKALRIREAKGWTDPKTGRVWVRAHGHPRARATKGHLVLRAILVLEHKIGRHLNWPYEVAHHLNGDKGDDRPENLELRTRSIHAREHETKHELSREELVDLYHGQGMTLKEIGARFGLHWSTIQIQMKKKGIPRRRSGAR